ncbi:MAG TPA: NYN domain-containing protein [Candidatus Polarisedimenticolaceae bacterium]|nr:NYN domain-containing protein [Candidatus Polarisedimenticolaceae bacterium]
MSVDDGILFERLGANGLKRVLDDLLDQRKLVRLANACSLEYPGMRAQSLKRTRLIADIVERAFNDRATMTAVSAAVHKETRDASLRWNRLADDEKAKRIGDDKFLRRKGNLGLHLFLLASTDADGIESLLARQPLFRSGDGDAATKDEGETRPPREQVRLEKKLAELNKKHQHLEAQLVKSRETERAFKRDLIQRKGELAEARMLVERLRGELIEMQQAARRAAAELPATPVIQEAIDKLDRAVRRLANEQKKTVHRLDKLGEAGDANGRAEAVRLDADQIEPLVTAVDAMRKELTAVRRDRKKESSAVAGAIDALREQLDALRDGSGGGGRRRSSSPKRKGEPDRVGVFIDVQNMYYGARQLKGKLDFDALRQAAVRDRRLIQAVAYVVESNEIDQSGFIKLLEQRAIEVRRKTLQVRADGSMKGDWDMELALDILDAAPDLDVVVLVSGDGDFTSLVKHVKTMGPRVEVIGFPRTTAKSLVGAADHFQPLDRKFMIYSGRSRTRGGRLPAGDHDEADGGVDKKTA